MSVSFQSVPAVPVVLRHIAHTQDGAMVFLVSETKTFVIQVDRISASALGLAAAGKRAPRPLTHDLLELVLAGFEASVERVLIQSVEDGVFSACITLKMKNELGTKIINVDSRPSDAFVLAIRKKCLLLVANTVLEKVEDVGGQLAEILKRAKAQKNG